MDLNYWISVVVGAVGGTMVGWIVVALLYYVVTRRS